MELKKTNRIIELNMEQVKPNPYQPRKTFDLHMLEDLSNSIRTYGVLQPIHVREVGGGQYELIAGERRLRASQMAGISQIPAIILKASDYESAVVALIENLQRENLNYMEEAEGYFNLMEEYQLTQEQLARQVGKSQASIANKLRLLKLSDKVVHKLLENGLSERHARALLKLPSERMQLKVLGRIIEQSLNVKKTEELIEQLLDSGRESRADKPSASPKAYLKDIKLFTNTIKQAVDSMNHNGLSVNYELKTKDDAYHISIVIPIKKEGEQS